MLLRYLWLLRYPLEAFSAASTAPVQTVSKQDSANHTAILMSFFSITLCAVKNYILIFFVHFLFLLSRDAVRGNRTHDADCASIGMESVCSGYRTFTLKLTTP